LTERVPGGSDLRNSVTESLSGSECLDEAERLRTRDHPTDA
jgi:hypothetical protein